MAKELRRLLMSKVEDEKSLLPVREVSQRFCIPVRTIYTWYQLGKIMGVNLNGRCLRLYKGSVDEAIAAIKLSKKR